jgi:hypothetical protein
MTPEKQQEILNKANSLKQLQLRQENIDKLDKQRLSIVKENDKYRLSFHGGDGWRSIPIQDEAVTMLINLIIDKAHEKEQQSINESLQALE